MVGQATKRVYIRRLTGVISKPVNFKSVLLPVCLLFLVFLSISLLPGCSSSNESSTTDFSRMLGYVPEEIVLNGVKMWYTDWSEVKKLNRAENITSLTQFLEYQSNSLKNRPQSMIDWSVYSDSPGPSWKRNTLLKNDIGFDIMGIDRIVYWGAAPDFSISEGNFNEAKIAESLTHLGYKKSEYLDYSYFDITGVDKNSTVRLRMMTEGMNQVAVLDDTVISTPNTRLMTMVFDVMAGNANAAIDIPAVRAVANNLEDILCGVIMVPESLYNATTPYHFEIPAGWGLLHEYTMVGIGYRADRERAYIDIVLYYPDIADAREDESEIVTRANGYVFNTQQPPGKEAMPLKKFSDLYDLEKPVIKAHEDGAALKLSCRLAEGERGLDPLVSYLGSQFDVLFLALDPAQYVAQ